MSDVLFVVLMGESIFDFRIKIQIPLNLIEASPIDIGED